MAKGTQPRLALGVDVGGTGVRAALVDEEGKLCSSVHQFDPQADQDKETILSNLARGMAHVLQAAPEGVAGVGMGIPGPFDYAQGICLMQNVAKYDALYGVNVQAELRRRLELPQELPMRFLNDAAAFALGEWHFGAAQGHRRVMAVTLGTGCGSAFLVDGRIQTTVPGAGENGYVYNLPYREGRVDDYISRRGILKLWQERQGKHRPDVDVAELAAAAYRGCWECRSLFEVWGEMLVEALAEPIGAFQPDCILLGGSIAKSMDLFAAPIRKGLARLAPQAKLTGAADLENAGVKGAASVVFQS